MRPVSTRLARGAYSLLLRLLQPVFLVRLWWRGRSEPTYREAIGERLGAYGTGGEAPASSGWIWVHAVSLGETRAAAALIDALRLARPGMKLLLTHGTATGREAGTELLRAGDLQVWQPYDTPQAVARFFACFRPAIGVLMETEVWPNLLHGAQVNAVPMVLANARLSERSQRKGQRMEALLRPAVASLALALAQTEDDAQRLRAAGASDVVVAGNLKFDMTPDDAQLARGALWRRGLGRDVLLAAVTREGEEALLLEAWARQPTPAQGRPLLLIVPRHPPRFDEVAAQVQAAGLTLARRSTWDDSPPAEALDADVWLGDSMREMALYYTLAQVALLGGSFAPLGGQNLIEAAACGCPIVMGPHTFNFTEAAELALAAGAALRVADIDGALQEALALLDAPARLAQR
ncbi:MAG: 3-deoxy-D-manno-octulosonic acid transferase [Burkholderiaceae bacterium]